MIFPLLVVLALFLLRKRIVGPLWVVAELMSHLGQRDFTAAHRGPVDPLIEPLVSNYNRLVARLAELDSVPDRAVMDTAVEEAAFRQAPAAVQTELAASGKRMQGLLPSEAHALFEVYAMLVGDESLASGVVERIRDGMWAPAALRDAIRELAAVFEAMDEERQRTRAEDIRAIGRRLLRELQADARGPREFPALTVLVGDEVSLARIADVPRERLAGIVCLRGSVLSHTVVVASALGVPAVMGLGDLSTDRLAGSTVVIDG